MRNFLSITAATCIAALVACQSKNDERKPIPVTLGSSDAVVKAREENNNELQEVEATLRNVGNYVKRFEDAKRLFDKAELAESQPLDFVKEAIAALRKSLVTEESGRYVRTASVQLKGVNDEKCKKVDIRVQFQKSAADRKSTELELKTCDSDKFVPLLHFAQNGEENSLQVFNTAIYFLNRFQPPPKDFGSFKTTTECTIQMDKRRIVSKLACTDLYVQIKESGSMNAALTFQAKGDPMILIQSTIYDSKALQFKIKFTLNQKANCTIQVSDKNGQNIVNDICPVGGN